MVVRSSRVSMCFGGWLRNRKGKEMCHEMQHGNIQVMTSEMIHSVVLQILCLKVFRYQKPTPKPLAEGSHWSIRVMKTNWYFLKEFLRVSCEMLLNAAGSLVPLVSRLTSVAVSESALAEQDEFPGCFWVVGFCFGTIPYHPCVVYIYIYLYIYQKNQPNVGIYTHVLFWNY